MDSDVLAGMLEQLIFWLIPAFLLCSFLVNHKTTSKKDDSAPKGQAPKTEAKVPSSRDKEGAMSDRDMTSS